jgi:hypothetical protein
MKFLFKWKIWKRLFISTKKCLALKADRSSCEELSLRGSRYCFAHQSKIPLIAAVVLPVTTWGITQAWNHFHPAEELTKLRLLSTRAEAHEKAETEIKQLSGFHDEFPHFHFFRGSGMFVRANSGFGLLTIENRSSLPIYDLSISIEEMNEKKAWFRSVWKPELKDVSVGDDGQPIPPAAIRTNFAIALMLPGSTEQRSIAVAPGRTNFNFVIVVNARNGSFRYRYHILADPEVFGVCPDALQAYQIFSMRWEKKPDGLFASLQKVEEFISERFPRDTNGAVDFGENWLNFMAN